MLGIKIELFISSNLQRRPSIFKNVVSMLARIIKIFIFPILQIRPSIFKEFCLLGRIKKTFIIFYFFKTARKTKNIYYLRSFFL